MQEITIQEARNFIGGSTAQSFANGLLAATGIGYLVGWWTTGQTDPGKWGKVC